LSRGIASLAASFFPQPRKEGFSFIPDS
jgi:hypothetical protein